MKERIEQFLSTAESPDTRDLPELKAIYKEITGGRVSKCDGEPCIVKMLTEVRKFYNKLVNSEKASERKYTLKDGNHSFAPGGPAVHNNDNTTDEDIENHLKLYPHIKRLLN